MQFTYFAVILTLIGFATSDSYVRFINPLQQDIEIASDKFPTFSLSFGQVTDYQDVSGNQDISITNVQTNGVSLTNNSPLLLEVDGDLFYTFVAYFENSTFYFVKYNESFDTSVDSSAAVSFAYVRLLDLASQSGLGFLSLVGSGNPNSATLFQYIGQWQQTSYVQVDTAFTSLIVASATSGEHFSVPTSFEAGKAYTVIIFNNGTGYSTEEVFDRVVSSSSASSTSGVIGGSDNNNDDSGSSKASALFGVLAMAAILSL